MRPSAINKAVENRDFSEHASTINYPTKALIEAGHGILFTPYYLYQRNHCFAGWATTGTSVETTRMNTRGYLEENNAGTKILFRMNYPESRKVAGFIRGRQGQDISERIEQLSVGSAFVQTPEMPYGSVTQMYPLSE